jgi:hypothetical protein
VEGLEPDVKARMVEGETKNFSTAGKTPPDAERLNLSDKMTKERNALLAERDAARVERDAALKKVPPDETGAGKARYKVNEASRKLGELHAEAYMKANYPDYELVYPPPGSKSRPGDFDQVWRKVKVLASGEKQYLLEHIVIEAKGGSSDLGSRMTGNIRAQQGTPEYFKAIVDLMAQGSPEMQKAAQGLKLAGDDGVKYLHVKVPIDGGPPSTVSSVVVGQFDLKPAP